MLPRRTGICGRTTVLRGCGVFSMQEICDFFQKGSLFMLYCSGDGFLSYTDSFIFQLSASPASVFSGDGKVLSVRGRIILLRVYDRRNGPEHSHFGKERAMNPITAVLTAVLIITSIPLGLNASASDDPYSEADPAAYSESDFLSEDEEGPGAPELPEGAQILKEDENLLIAVTGNDPEGLWGYKLDVFLQNKTDCELGFLVNDACINGLMMDPYFQTVLAPGQSSEEELEWFQSSLDEAGITDVTDIELEWCVYNYEDWSAEFLLEEKFHYYPLGEDAVQPFVREAKDTDQLLLDNDVCRIVAVRSEMDELWGFQIHLYMINKSDHGLTVGIDEASINGEACDPYWATMIYPERAAFDAVTWGNSFLEEAGVEKVESVELPFIIMNTDDYSQDEIRETVTYTP